MHRIDNERRLRRHGNPPSILWRSGAGNPLPPARSIDVEGLPVAFLPDNPREFVLRPQELAPRREEPALTPGQLWSRSVLTRGRAGAPPGLLEEPRVEARSWPDEPAWTSPVQGELEEEQTGSVNPICEAIAGPWMPASRLNGGLGYPVDSEADALEPSSTPKERRPDTVTRLLWMLAALGVVAAGIWAVSEPGALVAMAPETAARTKTIVRDTALEARARTREHWMAGQAFFALLSSFADNASPAAARETGPDAEPKPARAARWAVAEIRSLSREVIAWTQNEIHSWQATE